MTLQKNKLKVEIRKITDEAFDTFEGFPLSCNIATFRWATAINEYAKEITPTSTTSEEAMVLAQSILMGICTSNSAAQSADIFSQAIEGYSQIISIGMAPTFNGIPPSIQLNLLPIFTKGSQGANAEEVSEELSDTIHSWFLQGTAINVNTGVTINWS